MKPPNTRYRSITDHVREMLDNGEFVSNRHAAEILRCHIKAIQCARRRIDAGCPRPKDTGWTDERIEQMKMLWAGGYSASQIAGRLGGVTRNAVISKVHRLGLAGRATTSRLKNSIVRPKKTNGAKNGHSWSFKPVSPVRAILCDGLPLPPPAETDIARVSVFDVEPHHCRWVCSDDGDPLYAPRFCGATKVPGLQYCEAHVRRAYSPPQARRRELHVVEKELVPA